EGEQRHQRNSDGSERGGEKHFPLSSSDQRQRKQQSILRFVGEKPETNAREKRTRRQEIQGATDQGCSQEAVLPSERIVEGRRNGQRQYPTEISAYDRADRCEVRHETDEKPADKGRSIRKLRKRGCDEQERRRIVPGEIAGKTLLKDRELNLLLQIPVIGERRMALEHHLPCRPYVDEVGRHAEPMLIVNPCVREIGRRKKRQIDDKQHKADIEERGRHTGRR